VASVIVMVHEKHLSIGTETKDMMLFFTGFLEAAVVKVVHDIPEFREYILQRQNELNIRWNIFQNEM